MKMISLFSGICGFELAGSWLGWQPVATCELNQFGQRVAKYYWPEAYHHGDVKTLTYEKINKEAERQFGKDWRSGGVILTGGFPCQPYSVSGKRLGKADERHLWPEMRRLICEVAPDFIVGENVRGLISWNGGMVFDEVQADLEAAGYEVWAGVLPAGGIGAPHKRDRIWFVAKRIGNVEDTVRNGRLFAEPREEGAADGEQWHTGTGNSDGVCGGALAGDTTYSNGKRRPRQKHGETCATGLNQACAVRGVIGNVQSVRTTAQFSQSRYFPLGRGMGWCCAANAANAGLESERRRKINADGFEYTANATVTNNTIKKPKQPRDCEQGQRQFTGGNCEAHSTDASRWANFPTQSPVCGRNDGFPGRLAGITLSRWRRESIAAFGNAIVPQVAYQIFLAIESTLEK